MKYTRGTARMRGLAAELKSLRAKAGLNTREAAARAGLSASTLNRIELGNRVIEVEDMASLLVVYGITGVERERLLSTTREACLPGWWQRLDASLPKQQSAFISFESEAQRISHLAMLRIPGLMQTAEYIRAIMTAGHITGTELEARVAARLGRQALLTRSLPPRYRVVIDEAVLRRPVGGPQVMAEQLRHVARLATRTNIEVRVIPFQHGAHTGLDGTYTVLEFEKARPIVFLEHKASSLFVDEPEDVCPFQQTVDTLMDVALDSAESVNFLTLVAADYDQG
ncbi:helix-turn-helix domain-containing protein [Kibdelosporangium phytohabitans]|uniref:XRE family transcriptional regulator n=1 Tax=Kibdelosporangium phytohabitans TaxID=860235 RepID=A0A0N9IF55_9PSEU|nr:helix-turn-helix transcriptional regulator [Kibdelosporangium phytohabitans]ALG13453.1 XRE family transcriptional regulator [Kibdelosporangium phytohabitans]MBE1465299.1 transcriptional regulator with XRE-family HTH domain [Kibdelosporangium phytohabitans]